MHFFALKSQESQVPDGGMRERLEKNLNATTNFKGSKHSQESVRSDLLACCLVFILMFSNRFLVFLNSFATNSMSVLPEARGTMVPS